MIGHTLGAAGGLEAVFSVLAIRDNVAPPTINLDEPGDECDLDYVPHTARANAHRRRHVQFLWLWWHERHPGIQTL